jgi:hypothetical protein
VNSGGSKNDLIKHLPSNWPKAGFSNVGEVRRMGGSIVPSPTKNNPFHYLVDGLNAQQLSEIFKVENIKK